MFGVGSFSAHNGWCSLAEVPDPGWGLHYVNICVDDARAQESRGSYRVDVRGKLEPTPHLTFGWAPFPPACPHVRAPRIVPLLFQ